MNQTRRTLLGAIAAAAAPIPFGARAQSGAEQGYSVLPNPIPVEFPRKIEVVEFFWYGCPHCYNLEPLIEAWLPKLPKDAYFRRIPAVFNDRWALDASIYYAFESLGVLEKLHRPFFDAIHKDRLRTDNAEAFAEWLKNHGVEPKKMDDAMRSFGVQTKIKRAAQLSVASKIDGTPAFMVQGRYTISTDQGRSQAGMLANAEKLFPMVRKTLAAK